MMIETMIRVQPGLRSFGIPVRNEKDDIFRPHCVFCSPISAAKLEADYENSLLR